VMTGPPNYVPMLRVAYDPEAGETEDTARRQSR
jgi:hypothetical protein